MASTPSSSGRSPIGGVNTILPYRMHVSQRYLDLTRQKLELARLPREPQTRQQQYPHEFGVSKSVVEPLVDHWVENYKWRAQETFYNDSLPQYRLPIHGTRIHFVHRRSAAPDAIPLLVAHGWPESFIAISKTIDALCDPVSTPPRGDENVPSFHVVVPSIPGFGFSDQVPEEGNNIATTAEVFDALMKSLGYARYITQGSGWGLNICRMIALMHSDSCIAIHTCNPEVPASRNQFGYGSPALQMPGAQLHLSPPISPGHSPSGQPRMDRPQTTSYALCDSPVGLLAFIVDAIQPPPQPPASQPDASSSPSGLQNPWAPSDIINWAMMYWLPGPEVALRWLINSAPFVPNLWAGYCNVPLAISQYGDLNVVQQSTQSAEAYHRIAMVRRRPGVSRFPAWERPHEIVHDLRDLASLVGPSYSAALGGVMRF